MADRKKPLRLDVFLDTGVCITLPPGVDPDNLDASYSVIKTLAVEAFVDLLRSGGVDVNYEGVLKDEDGDYDPDDEGSVGGPVEPRE